jgi:hypothetical protein
MGESELDRQGTLSCTDVHHGVVAIPGELLSQDAPDTGADVGHRSQEQPKPGSVVGVLA